MELDLQLTPRSRVLLGILGAVLLLLIAVRGVPTIYHLFVNQGAKAKQEQLTKTENLVHAAEVLKPIEPEIYKATGLAQEDQPAQTGAQSAATLFDTELPETVIRARVDALIKRAGIQQNYQLLTKPGTGKQTQKLTIQNRERLVLYLYYKHIETEETELAEIAEQAAEAETFDMLMDAWLSEDTESETDEKMDETDAAVSDAEPPIEVPESAEWRFASLPETIPIRLRVQLAAYLKNMVMQQLRGATDFRQGFFEAQIHKVKTAATPGIFGIGAKPATVEIQLRRKSGLLDLLTQTEDEYAEEGTTTGELQAALVKYIGEIQSQTAILLEQLALAPSTYETRLYTVEMKFKTDLEKLVNLNHLIETNAKWLTVRDLRISANKQASRSESQRGRSREGDAGSDLNVEILLLAQIF
jgi:hypothetical protein